MHRRRLVVLPVTVAAVAVLSACGANSGAGAAASTGTPAPGPSTSGAAATSFPAAHPAASTAPGGDPTASAPRCGVDLSAPVIRDAIARMPVEPGTGWAWNTNPRSFMGNFDPCATLSTAIITIDGATGSSPDQALLFHRGTWLGTATSRAYGFTTLSDATTDDTVVLRYKTPGSCNACPDGTYTVVSYHWDGQRVVMTGNPPS